MMNRFDVLRSRCAKSNPILFFVLVVSIMVSGCGSDNEAQDSITGTLIVVVSISDGTPEPNASVTLSPGNSTLVTNDQGTVRFNDLELGTYQVSVELSMDSDAFVEGLIYEFSVTLSEENDTEILEAEVIEPVQPIQETDPDIDVLLANTYTMLKDPFLFGTEGYSLYWGDIGTDLAYVDQNSSAVYSSLDNYVFEPSNTVINDVWAIHYRAIRNTNLGLELIAEGNYVSELGKEERVLNAEFRFLRALLYFNLLKLYGNPVLVTSTSATVLGQDRSSLKDLIEVDLLFAEANLESFINSKSASVPAAQVLLGQFYLYSAGFPDLDVEKYALAASQFDKVMNQFNLEQDYSSVFRVDNESNNSEIIFSIDFDVLKTNGGGNVGVFWGPLGYAVNDILRLDPKFMQEFFSDAADFQNPITFPLNIEDNRFFTNIASFTVQNGTAINATDVENWRPLKYIGDVSTAPGIGLSSEDFPFIRYANVLLMAAEVENAINGPTAKAYELVNQIIARSHTSADFLLQNGLSQNELLTEILSQHRKELCFEGSYKDALIRNQLLSEVIEDFNTRNPGLSKQFAPHKYIWPIPADEINLNPNVVQNPGY